MADITEQEERDNTLDHFSFRIAKKTHVSAIQTD